MSKSSSYTDDYYSLKAQKEGILARSYYKLEEIDHKFDIFSHFSDGDWVLDLGCCPGSWVQYSLKASPRTNILGIDLKNTPKQGFDGKFQFIQGDIEKIQIEDLLKITENRKFLAVLSDMAPNTSGNPDGDAYISYELVLLAWNMAKKLLFTGSRGVFISKYFQGSESESLFKLLRKEAKVHSGKGSLFKFGQMKLFKPQATRKNSREIYIIIK